MLRRFTKYLAAASLLLLVAGGWPQAWCGQPLKAGTEVFAVNPAKVLEVSYRSSDLRMIAHRWHVRDKFLILFMTKQHRQPAVCLSGEGFAFVLKQLTSLKLRQTLSPRKAKEYFQKNPLSGWAELVIRDDSQVGPFRALISPVAGSSTEALVHFRGVTYIIGLDGKVFQLISGGCQSLSGPKPVSKRGGQGLPTPSPSPKPPAR